MRNYLVSVEVENDIGDIDIEETKVQAENFCMDPHGKGFLFTVFNQNSGENENVSWVSIEGLISIENQKEGE